MLEKEEKKVFCWLMIKPDWNVVVFRSGKLNALSTLTFALEI